MGAEIFKVEYVEEGKRKAGFKICFKEYMKVWVAESAMEADSWMKAIGVLQTESSEKVTESEAVHLATHALGKLISNISTPKRKD